MRFIGLGAFLLLVAMVGAYITRPDEGWHRGVASALISQGKVIKPDSNSMEFAFQDFYVGTVSVMSSGDRSLLTCWGAFTRFLCLGPAGEQTPPAQPSPGAS